MIAAYIQSTAPETRSSYIELPTTRENIRQNLDALGVSDQVGYRICALESCNNNTLDGCLFGMDKTGVTLEEVNFLAYRLENLGQNDAEIYEGLLILHSPESVKDMINLTANLNGEIYFVPEIQTTKDLGGFLIENGFVEIPQEYWKYLDYAAIGEEHLAYHTAAITNNGYIEDGHLPEEMIEIYDGKKLPEIEWPEQNMGQEMSF